MNILYFAPIRIYPTGHGNIAKVVRHLERLRQNGHKVHYLYFEEQGLSSFELFYAQNFVETMDIIYQDRNICRNRTNGYYEFDSWYQNGVGEKVAELCKLYKIDVVICTYVMYSKLLEFVPDNILKIIDTHDKMSDRHLSLIKNNISDEFFSCTKQDEICYLNRADVVWGIRDEETEYFNSVLGKNKAITVSHFDEPNFLEKNINIIKKIGFLASDNNVNAKMVIEFSEEILKHDKCLKTDLEIIIGGNVKKILEQNKIFMDKIQNSPIKLVGKFEKLEDFYKTIDAVIVPIMFGTGINIKMIEAMSFGLPVISTKCGIKGVNSNSKYHSANSMKELIDLIVRLYNNPQDIASLTEVSKNLFLAFYNKNAKTFDDCFTKEFIRKHLIDNKCSGCGICVNFCPHNAIDIKKNTDGFYQIIRNENCTNCGLCYKLCATKNRTTIEATSKYDKVFGNYVNVYSVKSINNEIQYNSSTAGFIRTFLIENVDLFDGVITLCETEKPLNPEVRLLHSADEIIKNIAKSKYFSIEVSKISQILKNKEGNYIVVGLPCQIASLNRAKKYLKVNFFSIELFCGAIYSQNLMEKYFNLKNIKPNKIDFKDKEAGWHDISLALYENDSSKIIKTKANDDEFYFAQRNRFCTLESCLKCKYSYQGTADIQVGDFWGEKFKDNETGINLVIARSKKADELINETQNIEIEKCSREDVYNSQPWFVETNEMLENYEKNIKQDDLNSLTNKLKLNRIMQDYVNNSFKISELKRVYEINKRKIEISQIQQDDSFVIIASDCSSMQSFGDQAMNASLLSKIYEKYPSAKVAYFSFWNNKDYAEFENDYKYKINFLRPDENETKTLADRFREQAKDYKTLIIIGADILDGGCGIQQAVDYYKVIFEALSSGKKVIVTGMSFNTSNYPEVIEELINVSYTGAIINVRDSISYSRLKKLGCKNLVQVADMAFLFDETKYKTSEFANNLKTQLERYKMQGKKIIALYLTSTKEKADDFIDKVVKSLENYKDALFVAFPQDYRVYDTLLSDEVMCNKIYKKMNSLGFEAINAYQLQNEIDVKSTIELCDLLITCRMHIAIAALSKNVPVISFVYQGKFEGLYNFYDFGHNLMFEKDNLEIDRLKNTLSYLLNNDFSKMIEEKNKNVFELAEKNFEFTNKEE